MKKALVAVALSSFIILSTSTLALAEQGSGSDGNTAHASETGTSGDSTNLPRLKKLADTEINKRLGALNSLENIVKHAQCLSAADKAKIQAEIDAEQTTLPQVKTEIENDNDETTEQEHVSRVKDEFKNFALIMPKVHLLRVADHLTCAITKVTKYADRLQTDIDAAKTAGKDVTTLDTTMTDMRAQLKTASDDLNSATSTIISTTPAQFAADPTIVTKVKDQLNVGRQAIIQALKDGHSIRAGLKALNQV